MLNMIQKNSRLTNYAKTYFEGVINQFVLACRQGSKPARKPPPPLPLPTIQFVWSAGKPAAEW